MCGIVGQVSRTESAARVRKWSPEAVLEAIWHRGPDMQGQYADGTVWLGHVRLSILDVSEAGRQPMVSADERFVICYNGEVYNFTDIAAALGSEGLRSHSDTEVLLRAFATLGTESFGLFNGMFAFSIYDKHAQKMWLVRDRLGIKPLYYRLDADRLSFASEIKGVLAVTDDVASCNLGAVHEWAYYGNSLGERTLFEGINSLLPGHYLELDLASFTSKIGCYWSPVRPTVPRRRTPSVEERVVETRRLLEQAVQRQLVSDVPVGVFLSGGVDSSAITAFASRHYLGKLATYSVGFDFDKGVNELPKARRIAEEYGTDHHEIHVSGIEIADVVQKMVEHHDMPFSDAANIPLYLLSAKVNGATKVILQGDGGDELFGGYSRYSTLSFFKSARALACFGNWANGFMPHNAQYFRRQRYINALKSRDLAETMALLLTEEDRDSDPTVMFTPAFRQLIKASDPFARYKECQRKFSAEDPVNQMLLVDTMIILPDIFLEKVDRATMAASIEVRVPFLDNDLVDFCMGLSGSEKVPFGRKKWLLRKALKGIVPDYILHGKKTGFGVPYGYWLRGALRPLFFDQLQTFQNKHPMILDGVAIQRIYEEHVSRQRDRSFLLWKTLNFMIWANRSGVSLAC